jgi:uncharacterized repeat protein (TIGR03806 family)
MRLRRALARSFLTLGICLIALAGPGCSHQRPVKAFLEEPFPHKLSEWHLFTSNSPALVPNRGVVPYDLNTPLFSDYAEKYRFVWMPAGTAAEYSNEGPFDFPVGTVLAKTFAFQQNGTNFDKLIETRLLVHARSGWVSLPYIWDPAQHDATLQLVPDPVPIRYTDAAHKTHDFTYVIPNANECHQCHENQKVLLPIGPKARNLNKEFVYASGTENQLEHWAKIGYLRGLPEAASRPRVPQWTDRLAPVSDRARAYLDNNCAHCHQPGGQAGYTGVDFRWSQTGFAHEGFCKSPNSAGQVGGLRYDIVPGHPEESILIYRLSSTAPKVSMPALGRDVVHEEGVALLREWIASLPGGCGQEIGARSAMGDQ